MVNPKLMHLTASLLEHQPAFAIGDIVIFKEGLANKRIEGEAVVTELIEPAVLATGEYPGSAYYREPLDMKVSYLTPDDEFIEVHVDSRRFRLV